MPALFQEIRPNFKGYEGWEGGIGGGGYLKDFPNIPRLGHSSL